jgi:hydrogenase nickel incorporation protein HypA/HybF
MHELSIVQAMIEQACEAAVREGASRVIRLSARIGVLTGVVRESLLFSFELASEGTVCEGAVLEVESVEVTVMCPQCNLPRTLHESYWRMVCPECGTSTAEVLGGRELELVSIEVESPEAASHATANR